ncbi:putative chain dehydrogenase/reductase [Anaeramoeba flamelloides]|uniref:Chain dehydrogenase/reductase n=1 Tax=Anaeramoeba flamelloides TaxID=1746091 RepID=A0AAV7Z767_9EUKA|nr:putative chain dehydrogenase/reductase [Anaeramoeba flamelloides]
MEKIVLVTGGNRGIGYETCKKFANLKGYHVILTSRNEEAGNEAIEKLKKETQSTEITYFQLDVTSDENVLKCKEFVVEKFGKLDILINNAGISFDWSLNFFEAEMENYLQTFDVNLFGVIRMTKAFVPLMIEKGYGRVVNVSSMAGQTEFLSTTKGISSYPLSKYSLNGLVRIVSNSIPEKVDVQVNNMHPGWCKTRLGTTKAPREPEVGARTILWLALQDSNFKSGGFYMDNKEFDW